MKITPIRIAITVYVVYFVLLFSLILVIYPTSVSDDPVTLVQSAAMVLLSMLDGPRLLVIEPLYSFDWYTESLRSGSIFGRILSTLSLHFPPLVWTALAIASHKLWMKYKQTSETTELK